MGIYIIFISGFLLVDNFAEYLYSKIQTFKY